MKESFQSINPDLLNNRFGEEFGTALSFHVRRFLPHLYRLVDRALPTVGAILAVGVVLFSCITLFLHQLAEYG